jgi:hypothetical protein
MFQIKLYKPSFSEILNPIFQLQFWITFMIQIEKVFQFGYSKGSIAYRNQELICRCIYWWAIQQFTMSSFVPVKLNHNQNVIRSFQWCR